MHPPAEGTEMVSRGKDAQRRFRLTGTYIEIRTKRYMDGLPLGGARELRCSTTVQEKQGQISLRSLFLSLNVAETSTGRPGQFLHWTKRCLQGLGLKASASPFPFSHVRLEALYHSTAQEKEGPCIYSTA